MTKVVVLDKEGSGFIGFYDGYGRVGEGGAEVLDMTEPEVWHHACYVAMGRPEYSGPSRSADDQGCTNYDLTRPKTKQDVEGLRDWQQNFLRKQREEIRAVWKKGNDELRAEGEPVPDYALALETRGGE
jgi:hypothetical protein